MNNIDNIIQSSKGDLISIFEGIDSISEENTLRVMSAFSEFRVSDAMFAPTSGYGYNDRGREVLDQVWAKVFGTESAIVRHSIASGTHAIAVGLFALLRPGDTMLCVSGTPYDTLAATIGVNKPSPSSLLAHGVNYQQIELTADNDFDYGAIEVALQNKPAMVYVQRSGGYSPRTALSCEKINKLTAFVRQRCSAYVVVDNCYGEFAETTEPTADLLIGSLIKNPGGGMAESGGYLCGSQKAVDLCAERLTAPGVGGEIGASLGQNKSLFRGLFYAPHTTAQAMKTAVFAAYLFEKLGYGTAPRYKDTRHDIVQQVHLGNAEKLLAFCSGLQAASPIDSHVTPIPWDMPGYDHQVVMAAGAFVSGASIELSADAPMREPFTVFMQGGLTYESGKLGIISAAKAVLESPLTSQTTHRQGDPA